MKTKGIIVELTLDEVRALHIILGNLNDIDYLKYAETSNNMGLLKGIYRGIFKISIDEED